MQLTGTNRSIGLIALIFSVHDSLSLPGSTRQSIEMNENKRDLCSARAWVPGSSPGTALDRFAISLASFSLSFAGLVVLARSMNPIPSRTRPLNFSAPMVLWLKPWESRSLPGLPSTRNSSLRVTNRKRRLLPEAAFLFVLTDRVKAHRPRR